MAIGIVGDAGVSYDFVQDGYSSPQSPIDSIVSCYRALEIGKFWFPAQIFNCEDGHVGFMLPCYMFDLSYYSHNVTFQDR
ncbi:hypothetical protein L6452_10082 [Arctium lappa]|uniref:Uncharacterized protein n=1 Tax=Arctium lappa TaxID=4217 RepID=A0ACB9DLM4_ARCLA|nr:hypothetical protein L6452_10082 [Arctium lappa]